MRYLQGVNVSFKVKFTNEKGIEIVVEDGWRLFKNIVTLSLVNGGNLAPSK